MQRFSTTDADFATRFDALVRDTRAGGRSVTADVSAIIARVAQEGFPAIADLTQRFDHVTLTPDNVEIGAAERKEAIARVPEAEARALRHAADRIRAFHELQRPEDGAHEDADGVRAGWRWTAVGRAGLYVPGGRAAYPSSVLMNAVPARVAGVGELVMVTPTPGGELNPLVMLAAELAGVDRVFRVGGAQAVAGLALGVAPLPPCDVIVGPGNAWVAEAKRQLFGRVGIDMVAGPSEILVVADGTARPDWVAADLLSQAEHDPLAQSILITDSDALADAVPVEIERLLPSLGSAETARASWERYGAIIRVASLDEAPALVNRIAPEHAELMVADPRALFAGIRNAGSVFLGRFTPEAIGDYVGGPNHVLPTGRRAKFSSGLTVRNFMKRTTWLDAGERGFHQLAGTAATLADAEGLPAHALSVRIRLGEG